MAYRVNKNDLRALNNTLRRLGKVTRDDANLALRDFGIRSQFDIKQDAPVDTSNLKQNVNFQMLDKNTVQVESIALSDQDYDYAPVQEFGSIHRSPKPYFYPNIHRNMKRALVFLRNRIKNNVK